MIFLERYHLIIKAKTYIYGVKMSLDTANTFFPVQSSLTSCFGGLHVSNQKKDITLWIQFNIIIFHNSSSASSHVLASLVGHTTVKHPASPCPSPHLFQRMFSCFLLHAHIYPPAPTHNQEMVVGARFSKPVQKWLPNSVGRLCQQIHCARSKIFSLLTYQ